MKKIILKNDEKEYTYMLDIINSLGGKKLNCTWLITDIEAYPNNKDINSIAEFHEKFEHIHPFQDGNGRIGRFIILRQCIKNGIDLIAIDDAYNKDYRTALYKAQSTGEIKDLVEVFNKCQKRLDEKLVNDIPTIEQVSKENSNKNEKNLRKLKKRA